MRAAIYLRVSTDNKGQDPENQLTDLRKYYQTQGWELVKEYVDYDSASKARNGQQFITMLDDARTRKYDVLLFWSLDRFSREGVYTTLTYLHNLASYGVEFFSYTEQYLNSLGVFREAVISILATIAKQESIRISERTKAGIARARLKGTRSGRAIGRPARGIEPAQVAAMRAQGYSWPRIAKELGVGQGTAVRAFALSETLSNSAPSLDFVLR